MAGRAQQEVARDSIKLSWRDAKKAPCKMVRGTDAVVDGGTVYFRDGTTVYVYNSSDKTWDSLPICPTKGCPLAVVNNVLTTIGGKSDGSYEVTNQLFSLTGERRWEEVFKPMPTKRDRSIAVCCGQALIVAGGYDLMGEKLRTVEVMDIATQQWSTAAGLPEPLHEASVTICGDCIYMLGGWGDSVRATKSVYTCLLTDLLQSCQPRSLAAHLAPSLSLTRSTVWDRVADLPVTQSTCVALHGRLLAIGGCDSKGTHTSDVHIYHPTSNTWEVFSKVRAKMRVGRNKCFAAVLPNNQLMVVGGNTAVSNFSKTDSVEIADVV